MVRDRIVDIGADGSAPQCTPQGVPSAAPYHVEVAGGVVCSQRRGYLGAFQQTVVSARDFAPALVPAWEVRQQDAEHGCLHLVQTAVAPTRELRAIPDAPAVLSQAPNTSSEERIAGYDGAGI